MFEGVVLAEPVGVVGERVELGGGAVGVVGLGRGEVGGGLRGGDGSHVGGIAREVWRERERWSAWQGRNAEARGAPSFVRDGSPSARRQREKKDRQAAGAAVAENNACQASGAGGA